MKRRQYYNNIDEIINAVKNGIRVYYRNSNYEVVKHEIGYIVYCNLTNASMGYLTCYHDLANDFYSQIC